MVGRLDAYKLIPGGGFAVTPDDDADLPEPIIGFTVATEGDVAVVYVDGDEPPPLPGRVVGQDYGGLIRRIKATGTTAAGIIGYT